MMTRRLWFNVPLCANCWAAAVGPDKQATVTAGNPADECCVKCGEELDAPIYVRTCFPPSDEQTVTGLAETLADLAMACCSSLAGRPVEWPCPDRAAVGTLLPDPSNHMLLHLTGGAS
jgi:hypothetical protein